MLFNIWVPKKNVERIMNEIIAFISTTLNENTSKFIKTTKFYYVKNYIIVTIDVCTKEIMVNANLDFLIHKIFQKN
jgi:hypothetical protein